MHLLLSTSSIAHSCRIPLTKRASCITKYSQFIAGISQLEASQIGADAPVLAAVFKRILVALDGSLRRSAYGFQWMMVQVSHRA